MLYSSMATGIDTLQLYERFKAANLDDKAAKEIAEVFKEAEQSRLGELATKEDMARLDASLRLEMADMKADLRLLKWMLGFVIAGILSLILKTFFA